MTSREKFGNKSTPDNIFFVKGNKKSFNKR